MNKQPKYQAYKPSGVEWLGEIPEHWKLTRLGAVLKPVSERNRTDLPLLSITREKGVILRNLDDEEENHNFIPDDLTNYKILRKGQFGMNKMKAWQGSYGISNQDGIVSPAYFIFKLKQEIETNFFHVAIRSKLYVAFFGSASDGVRIGQWDLSKERMKQIPFLIPPLTEQTAIAEFLDRKTSLIDQAISIKEKQIELLKERRQILIHHAVTRGLNPDVKLKNSCVEWIGEIPEHWKEKRLKYVVEILKRIIGFEGPDVLSITQQGIKVKDITSGEGQLSMDYSKYQIIHKGEFAMNHMDLLTGYVDISKFDGVISPDYRVFTSKSKDIHDSYLLILFQVGYKSKIFYRYGQGVSQLGRWRFPADNFNNFRIPIPPIKEQVEIVNNIEKQTLKIATAISLKEKEIEKLKEYKASLINEVVTGKIKVN